MPKVTQFVSHVHLPVQSGSDAVLSAMKRNHSAEDYLATDSQNLKQRDLIFIFPLILLLAFLTKQMTILWQR
jgi:tRNA A37 methylthiotransferase MiaB